MQQQRFILAISFRRCYVRTSRSSSYSYAVLASPTESLRTHFISCVEKPICNVLLSATAQCFFWPRMGATLIFLTCAATSLAFDSHLLSTKDFIQDLESCVPRLDLASQVLVFFE